MPAHGAEYVVWLAAIALHELSPAQHTLLLVAAIELHARLPSPMHEIAHREGTSQTRGMEAHAS